MAREQIAPNRSASARRSGLTLLDVTLTIIIIGLLAAVGAPRFAHTLDGLNAQAGAERIAADLRRARQQARAQGRPQTVVFDPASHTYELLAMQGGERPGDPYVVDLTEPPYNVSLIAVNLGASGNDDTVVFDIYGQADYGGSLVVAAADQQRTVRIDSPTGRVTVE